MMLGIFLITCGIFDVVWTVILYTNAYNNCPRPSWKTGYENPCENGQLVWTWVATGIWGGFLVSADVIHILRFMA
jgi:hypothetical protein